MQRPSSSCTRFLRCTGPQRHSERRGSQQMSCIVESFIFRFSGRHSLVLIAGIRFNRSERIAIASRHLARCSRSSYVSRNALEWEERHSPTVSKALSSSLLRDWESRINSPARLISFREICRIASGIVVFPNMCNKGIIGRAP